MLIIHKNMKTLVIISAIIAVIATTAFSQDNPLKSYDEIVKINDTLSWTWRHGKQGMIDKNGREIIHNIYEDISGFKDGLAKTYRKGKQGLINMEGKVIAPCVYDDIAAFKDGIAHTEKRGKAGLLDISGNIILPNVYDDILIQKDSTFRVMLKGTEKIISKEEARKIRVETAELYAEKMKLKAEIEKAKAEIRKAKAEIKKAQAEMERHQLNHIDGKINMDIDNNNVSINDGEIHVKGPEGEVHINKDSMYISDNTGSNSDTTKIIFKKGKILFVSDKNYNEEHDVDMFVEPDDESEFEDENYKHDFHGNLSGIEFGPNNFLNNKQQLDLPVDGKLLELNTSRSWYLGLNFMHKSIDFTKNRDGHNQFKFGMVAGMGLAFNNYNFDKQILLLNDSTPINYSIDTINKIKKNKLFITYLTVPVLFEYQYPVDDAKLHFALGFIGSLRIITHQKQIFDNDEKYVKSKDFHLMPYKVEATARAGYGPFTLFANYSLTTLFENRKGPELYPVTVGLGLTF